MTAQSTKNKRLSYGQLVHTHKEEDEQQEVSVHAGFRLFEALVRVSRRLFA